MIADQNTSFLNKLLGVNDLSNPSLTYSVKEQELVRTIERCTQIVAKQPILLEVEPPVYVCGDIHGQYDDLLRIFNRCGFPPDSVYVFLGDYVDRGAQQIETISLLMSYKIMYPEAFFFLRGNHECSSINRTYGFYDECKRRYSTNLYNEFQRLFDVLPLCVLIGDRILGMHGGISPLWTSWDQLSDQTITRPMEPAHKSLASDILWSDPSPSALGWDRNSRGVSYTFGPAVVKDFCRRMNIDLIVRAHQVVHDGYEFFADGKLVTIFSAPRYCGEFDNNAAIMCVSSELRCRFEILKARTRAPRVTAKPAAAPRGGNDNSSSSRRSARKRENSSSSRKGKKKR